MSNKLRLIIGAALFAGITAFKWHDASIHVCILVVGAFICEEIEKLRKNG